jgi:hypothetical protein
MGPAKLFETIRDELAPHHAGKPLVVTRRGWDGLPLVMADPNDPATEISFGTLLAKLIKNSCQKNCTSFTTFPNTPFSLNSASYNDLATTNATLSYVIAGLSVVVFILGGIVSKPILIFLWNKVSGINWPSFKIPTLKLVSGSSTPNLNNPRHPSFFNRRISNSSLDNSHLSTRTSICSESTTNTFHSAQNHDNRQPARNPFYNDDNNDNNDNNDETINYDGDRQF